MEKQIRLANLKKAHKVLDDKAEIYFNTRRRLENLVSSIEMKKKNIGNLQKAVKELTSSITKDKDKNETLTKNNSLKKYYLPRYEDKVKKLEDYVLTKMDEVNAAKKRFEEKQIERKIIVHQNVSSLMKYIFPTKYINNNHDLHLGTEGVIAEASKTVCIRGKWQLQESECSSCYVIVAPYLPTDGDYTIYNDWVLTNKEPMPNSNLQSESTLIGNSAYRICAALTYTAHLVQQLSFYLDVKLPFKLNFCDFSKVNLSEQAFTRRVNRLNANIFYLCYTQKLKLTTLNASHTLENLYKLLYTNQCDLGRYGYNDISDCLPESAIMGIQVVAFHGDDSDNEDSDEATLTHEWESVPHNINAFDAGHIHQGLPQQSSFYTSLTSYFFGRK